MKKSEQHDLEKLLKDNLSDKTAKVPDFVWDNIEEELFPEKKRRGFFWLFFFGFGLIAAVSVFYLFSGNYSEVKSQSARNGAGQKVTEQERSAIHSSQHRTDNSGRKHTDAKPVSAVSPSETGNPGTKQLTIENGKEAGEPLKGSAKRNRGKGRKGVKSTSDPTNITSASQAVGNPSGNSANDPKTQLTENHQPESTDKHAEEAEKETKDSTAIAVLMDSTKNSSSANGDPAKPADTKPARFTISVYGGTNLYEVSVFKDYFTSGQLSNRPFRAGGFEAGAGFSYNVTPRLGIYSQLAFNRKAASFNYNLAITEADYFGHYKNGELIPLENIEDDGANSCFLVRDVIADYRIDTWLFSLGSNFRVMQRNKFTLAADLRFSANLNAKMQLDKLTVIQVQSFATERFNAFKLGTGINLDYRINPKFSIGISPMYHWQFSSDKNSFYKGKMHELVVPVRVGFWF